MGSVVLDAVNSFFGHPHTNAHASPGHSQLPSYREAPRTASTPKSAQTAKRSRSRSTSSGEERAERMTEPAQRATRSSAAQSSQDAQPDNARSQSQASSRANVAEPPSPSLAANTGVPAEAEQSQMGGSTASVPSTAGNRSSRPRKIKVRDLQHIRSFASENMADFSEIRSRSRSRSRATEDNGTQYEISEMKVEDIIEMVAGLLTKITTTNDRQHEHLHRAPPSISEASHLNQQTTSVLAFHGKNVPSITILSYLSRINKYCPTSYEVFLSLLVYFDRMTERVNAGPMQTLREANKQAVEANAQSSRTSSSGSLNSDEMEGITATTPSGTQQATPPYSGGMEKPLERGIPGTPHSRPNQPEADSPSIPAELSTTAGIDPYNLSHFFVVDSFNIHRLVIAGVTCASKFFSDIFYTNSRYAKVGGLPLPELNHLELQFLLLNDFRLSIPVEEIEAYGTMLVEFYAREVVAQQKAAEAAASMNERSLSESSTESAATVRAVG
ncbi:Putative cyclin PHO80 [Septoria linicola]|uniref:Cyclin PHO80 n=1 Tax=Septoria linicola TaxID=215465 RepID=A0A9Q9B2A1_9PEZI|nr:Putative cyclin PHO80 [Septoria linicola]